MSFLDKTAIEIGKMIKNKEVSSVEVTKAIFDNINKNDKTLNAYTLTFQEDAIKRAKEVQNKIDKNEITSLLAGVPVGIKDNIFVKGYPTTSCSNMLKNSISPYSATVVERLENAGAVILGKLNMDEFAMGGSNQTSAFGPVRNPWDLDRVPGGSSGGSSASVSGNEAFYALGSDTGGSIRQPCSFCNAVGLKPTYGTVSRYGVIPLSPSLDQVGPITRDVYDCATVLEIISGYDPKDQTTYKMSGFDFKDCYTTDLKGLKIGIPKNYFDSGLDEDVKQSVLNSVKIFEQLGATFEEFELNLNECAVATYYILSCAEATSCLAKFDGIKYGNKSDNDESLTELYINTRSENFGLTAKTRIMLGNLILSDKYYDIYYNKALKFRKHICETFKEVFKKYDLLLTPVCQTPAFKIAEKLTPEEAERRYFGDIYTVATNLAGIPGISIPCGFSKENLPIGLQLIGDRFSENNIIKASYAFQSSTDFHKKKPNFR